MNEDLRLADELVPREQRERHTTATVQTVHGDGYVDLEVGSVILTRVPTVKSATFAVGDVALVLVRGYQWVALGPVPG